MCVAFLSSAYWIRLPVITTLNLRLNHPQRATPRTSRSARYVSISFFGIPHPKVSFKSP